MVYKCIENIQSFLFPPCCPCCGNRGESEIFFCTGCYAGLPFNHHACRRCALPLPPKATAGSLCGLCTNSPPLFHQALTALRYEAPVSHLISSLKFRQRLQLLEPMAKLMVGRLAVVQDLPEVVIPVPLHPTRLRERGFNQSLEIARLLTKDLQIDLDWRSVRRVRPTPPQTGLSKKERRRNLRSAFIASERLQTRHVALFDDVITTGATLTELTRLLLRSGVKQVDIWALARTPAQASFTR